MSPGAHDDTGPGGPAFDAVAAARVLAEELCAIGSPERGVAERRYLKSDLEFFGVAVPDVRRVVTAAVRRVPSLDREAAVAWAVALWREPVHERRMAAVEVLRLALPQLGADDLATVEALIREARTWALVDSLAGDIAGTIALSHPSAAWPRIDGWAGDPDFWVRRSALLALLPAIRAGQPDLARLERYAIAMLAEKEFFIRKAIGWILRETSKRDPDWVTAWTAAHAPEMSGVTFREATRRLPPATADHLRALREAPPGRRTQCSRDCRTWPHDGW
jgi:3-methyladenine DNA glycosylase AlkD